MEFWSLSINYRGPDVSMGIWQWGKVRGDVGGWPGPGAGGEHGGGARGHSGRGRPYDVAVRPRCVALQALQTESCNGVNKVIVKYYSLVSF